MTTVNNSKLPGRKRNVSDMVFNELRSPILSGEWRPGERIPSENQLCEQLGVSRVSVRAAINRLSGQGLLESRQGGGTYVRVNTVADEFDSIIPYMISSNPDRISMFEFRKIIEVESVGLAAMRADVICIDSLRDTYNAMSNATDPSEIVKHDLAFHLLIAKATNNPVILRVFEIIQDIYLRPMLEQNVSIMGSTGSIYHDRMIRAIERRDVTLAKRLMEEHLNNTMEMTANLNQ